MAINQDDLLKELLEDFRIEAEEHLVSISEGLLKLENSLDSPDISVLESVYRETHSLKGAARAVNLTDTEKLCMVMENIMSSIKNGEAVIFESLFDIMYKSVDSLRLMLSSLKETGKEKRIPNFQQLIKNLEYIHKVSLEKEGGGKKESKPAKKELKRVLFDNKNDENIERDENKDSAPVISSEHETIRVSVSKLNKILDQTEDLIAIKSTLAFYKTELESINFKLADDRLSNLYGDLTRFIRVANRMVDDLILDVKSTLLLPFSTILNIVPRMVRDLAREKDKEINVEITGDHFLIDKRILEELKDPLVHLIRNCADHGIESSLQRERSGKGKNGKILIKVSKEADAKLSLLISDDGGGIKVDKVVNSAIKNGIIDEVRASLLSDDEKVNLIFSSGVSSSEMITEISGRGLGMAIVAEKISNLGGSVHVKSQEGKGTTFIIKIPQTIATFRALLVRCGEKQFLIPTLFIDKVVGVSPDDILTSGHRASLIVSGEHIGLVDLGLSLGLNETSSKDVKVLPALILNSNGKKMAFKVDEILEEIEGIIKPLGSQLKSIKKITGVTMVGNGILIPVVNVSELIEYAVGGMNSGSDKIKIKGITEQKQRVLIVEDSITVRSMLKSIVESAGYETEVAVDGVDGYNKLTDGNFDAVVTDIEMPNMNGFELTSKIKGDKKFSDIPVILVTTLESQKDMQRGLEAGANAYIVKGSFEKSNLTDTIRRLI
ncbi:MAG: hypothetical protein BGO30_03155 [Bacteroidetes bacterium 41-46]|nr:MAG: hypothetical protein BGO30_03155 [Bacteroidetes bacterium 41-46]